MKGVTRKGKCVVFFDLPQSYTSICGLYQYAKSAALFWTLQKIEKVKRQGRKHIGGMREREGFRGTNERISCCLIEGRKRKRAYFSIEES